ncbi:T9SS type A sorting domain-containing protein [Hymenobacter daeguensis]
MQTSVFNANATLPTLAAANIRIAQAQLSAPDAVPIATLLTRYERFRDDAGTAGLVTVSNGQLHDAPNRPRSPYEQRTLVTLCPLSSKVATHSPQFVFPAKLLFTNAAPTINTLEFDAGEGQGYRTATWDQPLSVTYPTDGTYALRFRLTCADGSVLLSQARLDVSQPAAARYAYEYPNTPNPDVVTRKSTDLFTDTRSYTDPNGGVLSTYAATGKITVAYAAGNTSRTIQKPLIVVEGYDASRTVNTQGVVRQADYDYNSFAFGRVFGGININYIDAATGLNVNFNNQLSEVGQYDLIFLNFDNGTDFIQRNAYLLERVIQWVNDNKVVPPGQTQKEKNIVLGMSMGGLVARYALRDMELRQNSGLASFSHDAKLYISHEAPHQGANVPLGFQYLVKGAASISLVPSLTASDLNPALAAFVNLLGQPATRQLLIYQTTAADNAAHAAWLNEYNQMGYPQQCRNVATSDGSECGRTQAFAPYAELVNIQGSGLLDDSYNNYANAGTLALGATVGFALLPAFGPAAPFAGVLAGLIFSFGNYEGTADFVVNALPNQQQLRIYHGKVVICKEVLFGAFSTCLVDYAEDRSSEATMLAYDSAPGGIYDITQIGGDIIGQIGTAFPIPLYRIMVQPTFCFVPTTSALDIGGGTTALGPQNLTASYSGAAPPAAPFNTPFANFITASRENQTHILWNGLNSKWAFQEMQGAPQVFNCQAFCQMVPVISGDAAICTGETKTYSVNAPTGATVQWNVFGPVSYTTSGNTITVTSATGGTNDRLTLTPTISSECGQFTVPSRSIALGAPLYTELIGPTTVDCSDPQEVYRITPFYADQNYSNISITGPASLKPLGYNHSGEFGLIFNGPGQVYVTMDIHNDCGDSQAMLYVTVQDCPARKATVTLYPNPARETVDVHIENASAATPFTVRLFDGYGRACAEQTSRGEATLRLNTEKLPAGLYFVHLLQGGKVVKREQLQIGE